jgi:hypothetical protein
MVVGVVVFHVRVLPDKRLGGHMVKKLWRKILAWLTRMGPRVLVIIATLGMGAVPRGFGLG